MSKWYKASELERLNTPMPMDGVNGLPDNHVITVSERTIEIDEPELVQNNVATDTYTLELDAEWDDITPVVIFSNSEGDYKVAYENAPTKIPAAVMAVVGAIDVSVFGLDSTGAVRVVTKAAPNTMNVVESGKFIGQVSSDDVSLLGQILQAVSDANTAAETANTAAENAGTTVNQLKENVETFLSQSQTSVNNAVSSAGTATTAANAAANTANTAANNADKSADTADAAATKANTSASRAENAYTTLQPILADISVSGNQPRKTLSGNIVSAKDAWPAKPLSIRVKGKTRQNLWVNPSGTNNGITVTANDDGSVTLSGKCADAASVYTEPIYKLKPNTKYFASISRVISNSTNAQISFAINGAYDIGYITNVHFGYPGYTTISFVTGSDIDVVRFQFYVGSAATFPVYLSGTYRIMLNEGDTAEPWCPPGLSSVDELSLVTAGKNLLARMESSLPYLNAGITFSDNGDGGIRVSGTATANAYYNFFNESTLKAPRITSGTYVASLVGNIAKTLNLTIGYYDDEIGGDYTSWLTTYITGVSNIGSIDRPVYLRPFLSVANGATVDTVVYPQLELGSTATDYEPPNVTQTPLPEVELRSLPNGTCDELVIGTDGTCEVVRKTKKKTLDGGSGTRLNSAQKQSNNKWVAYATKTSSGIIGNVGNNNYLSDKLKITNSLVECAENIGSLFITPEGNACIGVGEQTDFNSAIAYGNELLASNPSTLVCESAKYSTEPQSPVTLPVLPAPTFNVYHNSQVPSDTSVEYVRDINIALADLEAKIADLVTKEAANV